MQKDPVAVAGSAVGVMLVENTISSVSATIAPVLSDRIYHSLFVGSIMMIFSVIVLVSSVKGVGSRLKKTLVLVPIGVLAFGCLLDLLVLSYLRSTMYVTLLSITDEIVVPITLSSIVILVSSLVIFYLVKKAGED